MDRRGCGQHLHGQIQDLSVAHGDFVLVKPVLHGPKGHRRGGERVQTGRSDVTVHRPISRHSRPAAVLSGLNSPMKKRAGHMAPPTPTGHFFLLVISRWPRRLSARRPQRQSAACQRHRATSRPDAGCQQRRSCHQGSRSGRSLRTRHEAGDLAGLWVADQHLVVAHARKFALVAVFAIGLDPQHPVRRERHPIG